MGFIIGTGTFPSTWVSMRGIVFSPVPPPPFPNPDPVIAAHNTEWPASARFLKTIEGNGLLRVGTPATSFPELLFNPNDPPFKDLFNAGAFADPYPEQLVGRTVTTSGSVFVITPEAFTPEGQEAGEGGEPPLSVEWFTFLT